MQQNVFERLNAYSKAISKKNGNGIFLGLDSQGNFKFTKPQNSVLVLGPTRSGKTTSIIIPSAIMAPGPAVVTSTKLDIFEKTRAVRSLSGTCWIFNPSSSLEFNDKNVRQLKWSPLCAIDNWEGALLAASILTRSSRGNYGNGESFHWIERAQTTIAPILYAAKVSSYSMEWAYNCILTRDLRKVVQILSTLPDQLPNACLLSILKTQERELSGIFSTACSILSGFKSRAALEQSKAPNFSAQNFVNSSDTIYICSGSDEQQVQRPLITLLIEEIKRQAYLKANKEGLDKLDYPPIYFALDEVANIAPIPSLEQIATEGGGHNLIMLACFQDLSQASKRFGGNGERFLNLFPTKFFLPGITDAVTLRAISDTSGTIEVPSFTYHEKSSIRKSIIMSVFRNNQKYSKTIGFREEALLNMSTISKMDSKLALSIERNEAPRFLRQARYFETEPFKTLSSCSYLNSQMRNKSLNLSK